MIRKISDIFLSFLNSITGSYAQVFFSGNRIFALILMIVSFFDFWAGFSGLVAVMISNIAAYLIGFNRVNIRAGLYGFNSLLVGLGLGVHFEPGPQFFLVLAFSALLTLFITLMMEGVIGKYALPFLSVPFLLGIWAVTLATRSFSALQVSSRGIYVLNEMYALGGQPMLNLLNFFNDLPWHESIKFYFRALGAIFFQNYLFAGILIAGGLLICSRISFLLSLLGFFSAYAFYRFIGADFNALGSNFIGFNFILTAIALGGFFVIPSRWSFLWIILLTPLISIVLVSMIAIFSPLQLSIYSLPFNIIVLTFLYILKFRERYFLKPELTLYQSYSPEKNLYNSTNYKRRFGKDLYYHFSLPFWGEWKVTQGHDGTYTHKGEWRHAWDFELTDDQGSSHTGEGDHKEDYHCFGKPVLAAADGRVEEIVTSVEDNDAGHVNVENNWGNTIILRHGDHLFSKLSHLRNDSIRVAQGDWVAKGQFIASCGNSGRSPVPHLHFQIQTTPHIGSKTINYPIGHYIRHVNGEFQLRSFDHPKEDDLVSNIIRNGALAKAFHFIPGQKFRYEVKDGDDSLYTEEWEIRIDAVNNTYIECSRTGSKAWFRNDGDLHYFTHFEGNKTSLLFYYFLGCYTVMMGYYKNLVLKDDYPLNTVNNPLIVILQDFIAPFFLFVRSEFSLRYTGMDDDLMQTGIRMHSETISRIGRFVTRRIGFEIFLTQAGLESFTIIQKEKKMEAKLVKV
ncbi:MAG: urea transporter [bacterium]